MRIISSVITLSLLGSSTAFAPSSRTSKIVKQNPLQAVTVNGEDIKLLEEEYAKQDNEPKTVTVYESVVVPPAGIDLSKVSSLLTPAEAYQALAAKGEYNANASAVKTVFSAALGGAYVGMGAMLSLAVAGNSPALGAADPGLYKFLFGALFPVNLLLALQCGGQLYTGNTANMMAAVCEGKANVGDLARSWSLSWIGNFIGCTSFAVACKYAGVLEGGAGHLAAATLATKTSYELGPLFVKAMFCNWLVCLAVYLSMQAKDMTGKYLSIWLPVSCFVSIGFEHSVANMFLLPAGLMSTNDISIQTALFHNLLPVTVGNAVSGSLFVGAAMSFMYGKLGEEEVKEIAEIKEIKAEEKEQS
mmetsp:Transcript_9505/g.22381  ORF Transcript_9505/g.22381 Transcript_9505/m.22381 type:complete len:360 (+) Transcript_9505:74-1153(+)|eukprot:CAMPEP_0113625148 /NCGR_PEP_ID=MMETSP0017_2-20120614/12987_1 /TAXON_ID=2856 /ORGANISM="Cylindrotheca closterium" /LENGTH=359 /DNA_ID=CAMNT_0000535247 /DNA_START=145 /DNA_END=1224 /DNA_ORIENTATION=+ /assembly_acc=CAM_ASM_000147